MTVIPAAGPRSLPPLDDSNRAFWTGGRDGVLMVGRCAGCGRWALPPATGCPACGGTLEPTAASGRARVYTWTLNSYQYHPEIPPPYLIAIVMLEEQDDLLLATNLIGMEEADVHDGLPVQVVFEDHGDHFYPVFERAGAGAGAGTA